MKVKLRVQAPKGLPPGTYQVAGPEVYVGGQGEVTLIYKTVIEHEHDSYGSHRHEGKADLSEHRALSDDN